MCGPHVKMCGPFRPSAATISRSGTNLSSHCPGSRNAVTPWASWRNASFGSFSMWKCRSISPGRIVRPVRSMCSAPSGAGVRSSGPTAAMRPPATTTRPTETGGAPVPSMTCAPSSDSTTSAAVLRNAAARPAMTMRASRSMRRRQRMAHPMTAIARSVNRISRVGVCALMLAGVATSAVAQTTRSVRAWEETLALATTVEGPADPNPPFDLFAGERFNYPYALRNALTGTTRVEHYRALFLENEYLRVTVLPELGGHVYSCLDKISGHEMFYANKTIKKALIGYRGAWAAFGIEFNFPVSHNWMSVSPVASAIVSNRDGSASIWVGDVNAVFGSSWRVELRLRPGRAVLEQHTTLVNQGDTRHRYYWWTNAAVQVEDDSRLIYPTHLMA